MAAVVPGSAESDLIHWGFKTLVSSYAAYQDNCGGKGDVRPLADFADAIPATDTPAAVPASADENTDLPTSFTSAARPRRAAAGGGEKKSSRKEGAGSANAASASSSAVAEDPGPVPPPFGTVELTAAAAKAAPPRSRQSRRRVAESSGKSGEPAAEGAPPKEPDQTTLEGEELDPESYATWAAYYRQCAEHCEQKANPQKQSPHSAPASQALQQPDLTQQASAQQPLMQQAVQMPQPLPQPQPQPQSQPQPFQPVQPQPQPPQQQQQQQLQHVLQQDLLQQQRQQLLQQQQQIAEQIRMLELQDNQFHQAVGPSPIVLPAVAAGRAYGAMQFPGPISGRSLAPLFASPSPYAAQLGAAPLPGVPGGFGAAVPPPPPMPLGAGCALGQSCLGTDETLASLLMAWYLSGYHTGLYAARS